MLMGFGQRTGLKTTLRVAPISFALPLQRSMLRIVQEALANVHRHAAATRVSVCLRRVSQQLHLVISDDGQGMELTARPAANPSNWGLASREYPPGSNNSAASSTSVRVPKARPFT